MSDPVPALGARVEHLVRLIARLRAPDGCPWDREQTHESLKPMTIEEAYEVVEAIDRGDRELCGELGDLLLQVVYHAQLASERGAFALADVVQGITDKMVRRHPHVFGDAKAETPRDVRRAWEALKRKERAEAGGPDAVQVSTMLEGVSTALPAILEAYQVTAKVSHVGFDWPHARDVLAKLDEETAELRAAIAAGASHQRLQDEIGDLLFVIVNLARKLGVEPESALKATNRKFRRRFGHVERRLHERGRSPAESRLEEMDALWDEAKASERIGE